MIFGDYIQYNKFDGLHKSGLQEEWNLEFSEALIKGNTIYLTVNPDSLDEGKRIYGELKIGGEVLLLPTETFYSPFHTTVKDRERVYLAPKGQSAMCGLAFLLSLPFRFDIVKNVLV